ncbi:hypothetical protein [Motiliproteus sp.]|uniref:hypothetical protein n=1 Tax=Motiliproteus sp. TaxID=1898955 RepID=UPI003BA89436
MKIWYFETSAVNYLMDIMSAHDAVETKKIQLLKGRDWCISPVTLLEILQTSDPERRREIVEFAQCLFSSELLASPEETIIHYINQGFPSEEKRVRLSSQSLLADVWRDTSTNYKEINVDVEQLKNRNKILKSFTKMIHQVINGKDNIIIPTSENESFNYSLEAWLNSLEFIKNDSPYTQELRTIFKLSIVYLILLICCHVGPGQEITNRLWEKIGIDKTKCRINYALSNWEPLIYKGPLSTLAKMAYSQSLVRFSRGVYNDSLHAMYLNYTDLIFSDDGHFKDLQNALAGTPYFSRVQIMSEIPFKKESHRGEFKSNMVIT